MRPLKTAVTLACCFVHLQRGWKGHDHGSVVSCSSRTNDLSAAGVRMKSTAFGGKLNTLQGSLGRIVLDLFFFLSTVGTDVL